ncbi:MAG: prepilin-type N-terminal cleavage/methylation domain-containing protein [Chloroflexi bacterium]|nr:prepilin-type N-terminal cleavage/methylation domain-containing protein [Chloroflexota bacterium]
MKSSNKHGFTLIELLVVIAILAVLAVAVVLVLNPAELLKEGRDTTRISDLASLNSAIALYTADVINGGWPGSITYKCTSTSTAPSGAAGCSVASSTTVDGNGWVPINFNQIASGSPLPRLPIDPNNGSTGCKNQTGSSTVCQYAFIASTTLGVYKLEALMESNKFYAGAGTAVVGNDGGLYSGVYEVGSNLQLAD